MWRAINLEKVHQLWKGVILTCIDGICLVVQGPLEVVDTSLEDVSSGGGLGRDRGDQGGGGNHKQFHDGGGDERATDAVAAQPYPLVQFHATPPIQASRSLKRTMRSLPAVLLYTFYTVRRIILKKEHFYANWKLVHFSILGIHNPFES